MKKCSENQVHLTIGVDLGDKESEYCVLSPEKEVLEQGRLRTSPTAFKEWFCRHRQASVIFEVGAQSRWVQPLLRRVGVREAIAVDPRQLKLISNSLHKTDRKDAYVLARAGQGLPELLHPVEHRSRQAHADLSLLRSRELLTRQRTQLVNRIRGMAKATGQPVRSGSATYFFRKAPLQIPDELQDACRPLFEVLAKLHDELLAINRKLKAMATERYPAAQRLMTIPGVGIITALSFLLTIDQPDRFKDNRQIGAYLGLTPKKKESGLSSPQLGITKAGDRNLRRLLVICAHCVLLRAKDSPLGIWGHSLFHRGGKRAKKRAVVALARKISVLMLALLKSGQDYNPNHAANTQQPTQQVA